MPVFNAEETLHECLQSSFQQTLQRFELIVVNDNSTDASLEIVRSYNDPRVRVIDNQHKGIVAA